MRRPIQFLLAIVSLIFACEDQGVDPTRSDSQPTLALFVGLDGGTNRSGLWTLDADSLNPLDSLTTSGPPFSLVSSFSGEIYYSVWISYLPNFQYSYDLYAIHARPLSIVSRKTVTASSYGLASDKDQHFLLVYFIGVETIDRQTLSMVRRDTSVGFVFHATPSRKENKVFLTRVSNVFKGIVEYDIPSANIERTIEVADSSRRKNMEPADLIISPDGNFAFFSVFNHSLSGGGYNSFFHIDLSSGNVLSEHRCGAFAQLVVSPDGKKVYLSDPAGYLYGFFGSDDILVYDVASRTMSVFLDKPIDLGLVGSMFISDKMQVHPDGSSIYISLRGGENVKSRDGRQVHIIKVDIGSKKLLQSFSLPVDSSGSPNRSITMIKLSTYPRVGLR